MQLEGRVQSPPSHPHLAELQSASQLPSPNIDEVQPAAWQADQVAYCPPLFNGRAGVLPTPASGAGVGVGVAAAGVGAGADGPGLAPFVAGGGDVQVLPASSDPPPQAQHMEVAVKPKTS